MQVPGNALPVQQRQVQVQLQAQPGCPPGAWPSSTHLPSNPLTRSPLVTHPTPPTPPLLQVAKLIALYFVVAFGSSMDVAAIQTDSPRDLDYNQELVTVGECCFSFLCAIGCVRAHASAAGTIPTRCPMRMLAPPCPGVQ